MTARISDIPTHNAAPGATNKIESENPTGPTSEWSTMGEMFASLFQPATFNVYMSTPQAVLAGATDKLVLNTAVLNVGGYFDIATNHRWTPPAGPVMLHGQALVTSFTATDSYLVIIAKNGATLLQRVFGVKPGFMDGAVTGFDVANGTDYYELFVSCAAAPSDCTVNDFSGNTFFTGVALG